MARFEFEYTEIDGLLYPNIDIDGKVVLDGLGKYGRLRLNFLCGQKPQMYRELLLTGKLAEHCATVEKAAFEMSEKVCAQKGTPDTIYVFGVPSSSLFAIIAH